LSAGVVWFATPPTVNGATVSSAATLPNVTTAAAGGTAGTGGGTTNSGLDGKAGAVVQFQ
jgi:hypothetical protein